MCMHVFEASWARRCSELGSKHIAVFHMFNSACERLNTQSLILSFRRDGFSNID